ncbi:MAG TPA: anti-sigma factor [Steroidobacteraceae bacterium]|nr:anti-sigma factor [Steroidobacteraceae bacterium]
MNAPNDPPSDEVLAGEFVLGVLDARQRRELQSRVETDRVFAQHVERWEYRFAPLLTDIAPVAPPAQVWTGIRRRLGWAEREAPARFSLEFWRAATVLSTLVAIAAIVFAAGRLATVVPQPKPVTPLAHLDGTPGWLASVDAARGTVLMVPVPSAADPRGRVPELWLIPAGQAPRSLGVVSVSESYTVTVPQDARGALVAGSVLAITLEPPAGIPHAAPTGAIIAKGTIQPPASAS